MTAKGRLKKAKSSLDKLHSLILKDKSGESVNSEEIHFELENFLTTMRSVPDHLLEDYNKEYSLFIPLTTKLTSSKFRKKAEMLGNIDALNFINWYETEMKTLRIDPTCSFLFNQRHISIHRQRIQPVATRTISYSIDAVIGEATPNESKSLEEHPSQRRTLGWFFTENETQDILTMCDYHYRELRAFVERAQRNLP